MSEGDSKSRRETARVHRSARGGALFVVLSAALLSACGGASEPRQAQTADGVDVRFPEERNEAARHPATETVQRGEAQLAAGELDAARALFERAVEEDADDPRAHLDLGLAYELSNQYDDAERHYRAAVELDPDFPEALSNLGLLHRDQGRVDEAIPLLRRAVDLRPGFGEAWLNLAMALEEHGQEEAAVEAYRRAARVSPEDPSPRVNLGLLLLARGEVDQARIELRRALRHSSGNVAMLQAIGNGLRRAGDHALARRAMEDAVLSAEPETPALLSELALAQFADGDPEAAVSSLERALALDERYATAHFLLGTILARGGEAAEARRHMRRVIALEPDGPHAARARQALEELGR